MPDDYVCPITAEIMTDPVSTADGFSYERTAITEWLRTNDTTNDTSPFTGAKLESKMLIPNLTVRCHSNTFDRIRPVPFAAGSQTVASGHGRASSGGQRGIGERVRCVPLVCRASCVSWYVLCALCAVCAFSESLLVY